MIAPHSPPTSSTIIPLHHRPRLIPLPIQHAIHQSFLRKAILAKAVVYFGPETDYLPKRKRVPERGKSSRRLRLYWRSVDKELTHSNRPYQARSKHFNKRISVLVSKTL